MENVSNYRRKFKFFESENVSITVIDYGSVREKCQYCNHPLRYHYVVDDKKTGQAKRMKVGCECVKTFLHEAGVDEILIERADKVIKKQMAALNHVRKFENLDVDKLYETMNNVLMFNPQRISFIVRTEVDKKLSMLYGKDIWGHWDERERITKEVRETIAIKSLTEARSSSTYIDAKTLWDKKYYGKYRGLSNIYYRYVRNSDSFSKVALEDWRQKMIKVYLQPVSSPYYFG
jgi:hypothetical protein